MSERSPSATNCYPDCDAKLVRVENLGMLCERCGASYGVTRPKESV